MKSVFFTVELTSEVSISQTSRTLGGHQTLHYIPGANLKGALAARLYPKQTDSAAFRRFHSGRVRFHDALPALDGQPAYPMPLSLHSPKGASKSSSTNLAIANREAKTQYEQQRSGFLTTTNHVKKLEPRYSVRTAIDPDGTARDGFLFGIESLPAGERFIGRIDCDDESDVPALEKALTAGELRFGRSRTAEYGRAKVTLLPSPLPQPASTTVGTQILLYCTSDLALRDSTAGVPSLTPEAGHFGLPEQWQLDTERSFLRFRRYSPFNGTRRRPELERQVITAGSVLVFTGTTPVDRSKVHEACRCGVGDWREDGLGQVLVQPDFLCQNTISLPEAVETKSPPLPAPQDELMNWITSQTKLSDETLEGRTLASEWVVRWKKSRVPAAQWGQLRQLARRLRDRAASKVDVEQELKQQLCQGVATLPDRWGKQGAQLLKDFSNSQANLSIRLAALERCCIDVVRENRASKKES